MARAPFLPSGLILNPMMLTADQVATGPHRWSRWTFPPQRERRKFTCTAWASLQTLWGQSRLYTGALVPKQLAPLLTFFSFGSGLALAEPYRVLAVRNNTMGMTYLAMWSDRLSVCLPCLLKRYPQLQRECQKETKTLSIWIKIWVIVTWETYQNIQCQW